MTATPFNPAQALGKEALTYPNPARGLVHFAWRDANPDKVRIRVFNLLGEQVALIKADQPGQTLAWTTAGMAPGIYVYQVIITLQGTDKILPKAKLAILK
jgi:hypothetical protein